MFEARMMRKVLSFFLSFFVGGGGGHLSPFCVALADDSNKCYCYLLFKTFLVVYRPPAETDNPRTKANF